MSENPVLKLEIPVDKITLLRTHAHYRGKELDEFVTSIIDEWLFREQLMSTGHKRENSNKMNLAEFAIKSRKLKERIRQRGIEDTGDSVEILREIREERSNR